jgi:glutaminyl-peptide cyclotransferase
VQLNLANIIGSFNMQSPQRIMLCAHWDSRPRADQEKDKALQLHAIPGANDGASGVAVLLELAQIFKSMPPPIGIDIVFFDGEDYGKESDIDMYCLGSQYFANHLPPNFHPQYGVLLDMVGDKDAVFRREEVSTEYAQGVCDLLWGAAQAVHARTFLNAAGPGITDDHVPLNRAGIQTADIIDAGLIGDQDPNPRRHYWHTLRDTPDNCSPETLHDVGMTLLYFIFAELPRA